MKYFPAEKSVTLQDMMKAILVIPQTKAYLKGKSVKDQFLTKTEFLVFENQKNFQIVLILERTVPALKLSSKEKVYNVKVQV